MQRFRTHVLGSPLGRNPPALADRDSFPLEIDNDDTIGGRRPARALRRPAVGQQPQDPLLRRLPPRGMFEQPRSRFHPLTERRATRTAHPL
jgi:hypothetical protein